MVLMDCRSCGAQNPQAARFCLSCGAALAAEPPARREERKVVTVLFADLVDFTARSEKLDPEDVEALLAPYHAQLRRELERFGGTVEKFIGDAVMAVFGAPVAHEDDAERAIRAALAIRDWAREQEGLELRIGVNTGEALVSLAARQGQGEGMVKGDIVNTAARLQVAAPVNAVLVGETTYRATQRAIEYRQGEPVRAKGKSEPLLTWEALQARARFGIDVRQVGGAPLIGRGRELDALIDAFNRARSERAAQLVTLVGVPGIGKTRLVWELFQHLDKQPDLVTWRQGRSLPYGDGISFWALGEMVKAQAGILESDSPNGAAEKLGRAVESAMSDDSQRAWVAGHLRPLVGLGSERELGAERRAEAFAAWRRFLEALAEQRPTVLVFEDLHWADEGLLDFVDHLADWVSGVPLLLLGTARPELLSRRPSWGGGKANSLTLSLSALSDKQTAELVHALLASPVLPAETQQALLSRAGGNPLYAEEFVRLIEEGREEISLPATIQAIIAARLDALPEMEKQLIQQAAVLGKVFWLGGLEEVAGRDRWSVEQGLHALERKEFVRRDRSSSVAGETEYTFRHALVREVAYEQLPRGERAERHRRAAQWIESLGRAEDTAEMLAHHYLAAIEYARAAGKPTEDLAEPARTALRAAGERALSLNSFYPAQRFFAGALRLTAADDGTRPLVLFKHATSLHATGEPEAVAALEAAAEALLDIGDRERAAEAHVMLAELWWIAAKRARTDAHLARALDLIAEAPRGAPRARVLSEVSRYLMLASKDKEAIEVGREALELARELGLQEVEAHALDNIGVARMAQGDPSGQADLERSIEIALAVNSPEAARGYSNLATVLGLMGHRERERELRSMALNVDRRFGRTRIGRFQEALIIADDYWTGRWDTFLSRAERYLDEGGRLGHSYSELYLWGHKAMVFLARAADDDALRHARAGVEMAREAGDPQVLGPTLAQLVFVEAELGMDDDARAHGSEALKLSTGSFLHRPLTLFDLSFVAHGLALADELLATLGPKQHSSRWLSAAQSIGRRDFLRAATQIAEIGVPHHEALARLRAGEAFIADGRQMDAKSQLGKALEFWRTVGAKRYVEKAERLLGNLVDLGKSRTRSA